MTVHKILIYSVVIMKHAILPIRQLGEKIQENRSKNNNKFREHYSIKLSKTKIIKDIFNNLFVFSDPQICNMKNIYLKKVKIDVIQFLEEEKEKEEEREDYK